MHRFYLLEISEATFRILCNSVLNQKISQDYHCWLRINHTRFPSFHLFRWWSSTIKLVIVSSSLLTRKTLINFENFNIIAQFSAEFFYMTASFSDYEVRLSVFTLAGMIVGILCYVRCCNYHLSGYIIFRAGAKGRGRNKNRRI